MDNNKDALQYLSKKLFLRRKFDFILRTYSTLGWLIAIFAGAYFLLSLLPHSLTKPAVSEFMSQKLAIITLHGIS
jgi:hypothetical protein